jgi:hypothetical protein
LQNYKIYLKIIIIIIGFRFDAMLNYHTACVFYRVMETMIPSKTSAGQHTRLLYAAQRVRQCSNLYQNFVRENFIGGSCSDMYEVHGSSKLGKGSYGSVYLATHRFFFFILFFVLKNYCCCKIYKLNYKYAVHAKNDK